MLIKNKIAPKKRNSIELNNQHGKSLVFLQTKKGNKEERRKIEGINQFGL
jgi:hypothetical protein